SARPFPTTGPPCGNSSTHLTNPLSPGARVHAVPSTPPPLSIRRGGDAEGRILAHGFSQDRSEVPLPWVLSHEDRLALEVGATTLSIPPEKGHDDQLIDLSRVSASPQARMAPSIGVQPARS